MKLRKEFFFMATWNWEFCSWKIMVLIKKPDHGAPMGHVTMNLLRDKLYIVSQAVEEAVSPSSGVPVARNGICLSRTWQTAFSGSAPAVWCLWRVQEGLWGEWSLWARESHTDIGNFPCHHPAPSTQDMTIPRASPVTQSKVYTWSSGFWRCLYCSLGYFFLRGKQLVIFKCVSVKSQTRLPGLWGVFPVCPTPGEGHVTR